MRINEKLLKNTKYGKYIDMSYKTLWSGTWNSGSITISEENDIKYYNTFIFIADDNPFFVTWNDGRTYLTGCSISGNTTSTNYNQYIRTLGIQRRDRTLTLDWAKKLSHINSGQHATGTKINITKIIGLTPRIEML